MQLNRRKSERRKARIMEIGRRPIESELGRLGAMISHESRAEDQMTLTILVGIAEVISLQAEDMKSRIAEHRARLDAQQEIIAEHEEMVIKGKTSWWWLSVIVASLSISVPGILYYGYSLISELRDTVNDSVSAKKAVDDYIAKNQNSAAETNNRVVTNASSIDQVQQELNRIKKLRAVAGSK